MNFKLYLLSFLFYFSQFIVSAQTIPIENDTLIILKDNGLISNTAFSKVVSQDLDYLIFNNLSPKEGVSATVKADGTQIILNGKLYSGNKGTLTIGANLASTKGIYFFDEDTGGDDATITLNLFKPYHKRYFYQNNSDFGQTNLKVNAVKLISDAKAKLDYIMPRLFELVNIQENTNTAPVRSQNKFFDFPNDAENGKNYKETTAYKKLDCELRKLTKTYINSQDVKVYDNLPVGFFDSKDFEKKPNSRTASKIISESDVNDNPTIFSYTNDLQELLKQYQELYTYILNGELEKRVVTQEIKDAQEFWSSKHLLFYSVHPFYKRESLSIFNRSNNVIDSIDGDIYGITFNWFNYSYQNLQKNGSRYYPKKVFFRTGVTASRTSNRSQFKESNVVITEDLGIDPNGNPITSTSNTSAFTGENQYQYGNSLGLTAELIIYPFKLPVGFFSSIGYSKTVFPGATGISSIELSPMRLGTLLNFKKKDSEKDVVVVQLFLDRSDLSLSPNGVDNDLRFGLGIGVPLSF